MPSYIYNATTKELENVAGGTLFADSPIGTIFSYGGASTNLPSGFLLCDGSEVLKTEYADLYAVIGDSFGTASENTKFVLPDLREAVPVGSGTRGSGVSAHDTYTVGQFKDDQLQNHTHSLHRAVDGGSVRGVLYRADTADGFYGLALGSEETQIHATTIETGRTGTTTHGKQLGVNYVIKALKVATPADFDVTGIPDDVWAMIEALI